MDVMSAYSPTIGLEIHAELKTKTKMFCSSKNDSNEAGPNVNICPVCLAHPGVLPVINREAVKHVLRVGRALKGQLADYTEFDRKNYFYPDLPKGYQLSQYEYPLVSGGELRGVAITRVHLEEDTASSMHDESTGVTTVDYNRAGVPLMELVTEPVITSAKQAGDFARELQIVLRTLRASDANMEKGEMRVEANISVAKNGERGTKVEIKNLNSFRAMERAVEYEIRRQSALLEKGEKIVQETRGWDDAKQATFSQRAKEGSADYRYFPDPDLPSLGLSEIADFSADMLEGDMPELPAERRARYAELGVSSEDADLYVREVVLGNFFDEIVRLCGEGDSKSIKLTSNYIANDLVKLIRDVEGRDSDYQAEIVITPLNFKKMIDLVAAGRISSRAAKDMLAAAVGEGIAPDDYIATHKLLEPSADLGGVIAEVIKANEAVVADYKSGKETALEYLVGQVMKQTKGRADPAEARTLILKEIRSED